MNEVQVICTVISGGKEEDPDIPALIGASAALAISGIPLLSRLVLPALDMTRERIYIESKLRAARRIYARYGSGWHSICSFNGRIRGKTINRRPNAWSGAFRASRNAGRNKCH